MGHGHQQVGVWLEFTHSSHENKKKIKTKKIYSYESGGIFAKFCTSENFPLHGGLVSGLTQFTLKLLHFYGYTGMLSKSRSQALRLAPVMHLLFHFGEEGSLSDNVSDAAMKAAINFARVSCEQTAMIIGKGSVEEVIQRCQSGELIVYIQAPPWCKAPPTRHYLRLSQASAHGHVPRTIQYMLYI